MQPDGRWTEGSVNAYVEWPCRIYAPSTSIQANSAQVADSVAAQGILPADALVDRDDIVDVIAGPRTLNILVGAYRVTNVEYFRRSINITLTRWADSDGIIVI